MCEQLDEIKAILKETAEMSRKNKAEFDKYRKETEAAKKKTEREFRRIGHFWGEDTEVTFEQATKNGIIVEGREFIQNTTNYIVYDAKKKKKAEIDILMTNGKYILLIETKHNLPKYKKELKEIEALDAEFDRKIEMVKKYDAEFLKNKMILKAFATRNLKKENYQGYLDRGYLLLTIQNNKPQVITQKTESKKY